MVNVLADKLHIRS